MKTTKALIATLFTLIILFIMFAVSMPVHAEWKPYTYMDEMTDEIFKAVVIEYESEHEYKKPAFNIELYVACHNNRVSIRFTEIFTRINDESAIVAGLNESELTSDITDILVRFDKKPAFNIDVIQHHHDINSINIPMPGMKIYVIAKENDLNFDDTDNQFRLNLSKGITLRMKIKSFIARFSLVGFTKTYTSHCGHPVAR